MCGGRGEGERERERVRGRERERERKSETADAHTLTPRSWALGLLLIYARLGGDLDLSVRSPVWAISPQVRVVRPPAPSADSALSPLPPFLPPFLPPSFWLLPDIARSRAGPIRLAK